MADLGCWAALDKQQLVEGPLGMAWLQVPALLLLPLLLPLVCLQPGAWGVQEAARLWQLQLQVQLQAAVAIPGPRAAVQGR